MENVLLIGLAFGLGGILKGATGAGAPLLAVPVIALLYDVRFAVAVFLVPNIVPNVWQVWKYHRHIMPKELSWSLAFAGGAGAAMGSILLAGLPPEALEIGVALAVFAYVGFRLSRPDWTLSFRHAVRIVWPVGITAGLLQGATGISAPVSLSYLNAMKLERLQFIPTVSLFFMATGIVQAPMLAGLGIMSWEKLGYGILALIPLFGFMPMGSWLGRRVPKAVFDKIILAILVILAIRLLAAALL